MKLDDLRKMLRTGAEKKTEKAAPKEKPVEMNPKAFVIWANTTDGGYCYYNKKGGREKWIMGIEYATQFIDIRDVPKGIIHGGKLLSYESINDSCGVYRNKHRARIAHVWRVSECFKHHSIGFDLDELPQSTTLHVSGVLSKKITEASAAPEEMLIVDVAESATNIAEAEARQFRHRVAEMWKQKHNPSDYEVVADPSLHERMHFPTAQGKDLDKLAELVGLKRKGSK